MGDQVPDCDDPQRLVNFFRAIQHLNEQDLILAYHDRSDGGLWATLCEMAFTARVGLEIELNELGEDPIAVLFNEELGAVLQIESKNWDAVLALFKRYGLSQDVYQIAKLNTRAEMLVHHQDQLLSLSLYDLQEAWSDFSNHIHGLRDNPETVQQAIEAVANSKDTGLFWGPVRSTSLDQREQVIKSIDSKRVAILREQGVNGQVEMAAAFRLAGFEAIDVHMQDLMDGRVKLDDFIGLAACGGFSYGDVLGAGVGWAHSILYHDTLRDMFSRFFARPDTFTLGICNGCQMLAQLKEIIPRGTTLVTFLAQYLWAVRSAGGDG